MEHEYRHTCRGTCSRSIDFVLQEGLVKSVRFNGGCSGNAQGVARLVEGRPVDEVISLLRGVDCNGKGTSCPDQLARALDAAQEEEKLVQEEAESVPLES